MATESRRVVDILEGKKPHEVRSKEKSSSSQRDGRDRPKEGFQTLPGGFDRRVLKKDTLTQTQGGGPEGSNNPFEF